jgi:hypothetical protein
VGAAPIRTSSSSRTLQEWKGRYAIYQIHAVEQLQAIRDTIGGPLRVHSGYRNVSYNADVGGATWSRHMYGDSVDMSSSVASLNDLSDICDDLGAGYIGMYDTHVHCDWRDDILDPAFFDADRFQAIGHAPARPQHTGELVRDGEAWTAPATGFDEGEPLRQWTAWDDRGHVIDRMTGTRYIPPIQATRIDVVVGRQVTLSVAHR